MGLEMVLLVTRRNLVSSIYIRWDEGDVFNL